VSSGTTGISANPSIAVVGQPSSSFVVTWTAYSGPSFYEAWARRLDNVGAPLAAPFRVNTFTHDNINLEPAVAGDAAGSFVIVWDDSFDVWAQRYSANGAPVGGELRVSSSPASFPRRFPRVAAPGTGGRFVVTWTLNASPQSVYARQLCLLQGDA